MTESAHFAQPTKAKPRAFRLRGEPEGVKIKAIVKSGTKSIGSAPGNDIVVPVFGVSKKHATFSIVDGDLIVEDAGSKNGVFVNGVRTQRSSLKPGDWVQLGPAALVVEETAASDAELGIAMDAEEAPATMAPSPAAPTAEWAATHPRQRERWMPLLNRLSARLLSDAEPDLSQLLADLGEGLGADGAALVEWGSDPSPLVVASSGQISDVTAKPRIPEDLAGAIAARRGESIIFSAATNGPPPLAWAAAVRRGEPPQALLLAGDFPHRAAAGPLLEVVLRMALHARPQHLHFPVAEAAPVEVPDLAFPAGYISGRSAAILGVYEQLRHLLRGDIPVLLTGETGVGKEHIARILHASSPRARGAFVAVNCAAIPSELLEAELFGIEEGVATGVRRRDGKFQHAAGGVILLDEIGDAPLAVQAKLLRALQANEIHPVGARLPQRIDVRVIAATNTDLKARVESGQFRRDLYFRVAGYTLHVPALRDRRADIPLLVEHFLRSCAREIGKRIQGITVHALRALQNAPWPGNVRELEHEVRRLVYLCPAGQAIDASHLPPEILHPAPHQPPPADLADSDLRLAPHIETLERRLITLALGRARGNRSEAARLLEVSRAGLLKKLARLRLK
jgi:DNA-binding NtrC family response regulator